MMSTRPYSELHPGLLWPTSDTTQATGARRL